MPIPWILLTIPLTGSYPPLSLLRPPGVGITENLIAISSFVLPLMLFVALLYRWGRQSKSSQRSTLVAFGSFMVIIVWGFAWHRLVLFIEPEFFN